MRDKNLFLRLKMALASCVAALVLVTFSAPSIFAAPIAIVDLDMVEGDEVVVSVDPNPAKYGVDFKVVFHRKDGKPFNLPSVAWPNLSLADLADVNNLSDETVSALQSFGSKFYSAINGGADLVRVSLLNSDREAVVKVPFLVSNYPYLEQSDDKKTLSITMPITEEDINLPVASYLASVEVFNKNGDDLDGDELFDVKQSFNFNFDFGFDWGGFVLPGDEAVPADIKLSSNTVKPGTQMSINVYDQNAQLVDLPANSDWDLQIQSVTAAAVLNVGTYGNGDITKDGAGVYSFEAANKEGTYRVILLNEGNVKVDSADFTVKAGFLLDLSGAGLLDSFVDLDGILGGLDGFADVGADGGNVEQDLSDHPCVDVDDSYWGRDILQKLIDKDLYPVVRSLVSANVTCRPVDPVLRKEFTAWLLNAYRPDVVVNIDDLDLSDMPFPDVDDEDPYAPYILKAYALGIISGNPDGTFKPDAQINRAEVLKILLRSSNLFNATDDEMTDLIDNHADESPSIRFKDAKNENSWYYPYLYYGVVKSIIQGYADGNAKMEQGVIYGEAAKILYLSLKLEGKID